MKNLLIIQNGGYGDLMLIMPIALWYSERGYKVYLRCDIIQYGSFLKAFEYVTPTIQDFGFNKIIDLNFGRDPNHRLNNWFFKGNHGMNFVEAKYHLAEVPIEQKENFVYTRNENRENRMLEACKITVDKFKQNGESEFVLFHRQGAKGTEIQKETIAEIWQQENALPVPFLPKTGYSIMDWRLVIESAKKVICIDSSLSNFIELAKIGNKEKNILYDIRETDNRLKSMYSIFTIKK